MDHCFIPENLQIKNTSDIVELKRTFEIHYKKGQFFHKLFDNNNLIFGKMKKTKIKMVLPKPNETKFFIN